MIVTGQEALHSEDPSHLIKVGLEKWTSASEIVLVESAH